MGRPGGGAASVREPGFRREGPLHPPGVPAGRQRPGGADRLRCAYALADGFGLRSAEPDLPTHFFFEPGADPERQEDAESAIVSLFCEVRGRPPPDKHWALEMVRAKQAIDYAASKNPENAGGARIRVAQPDTGIVPNPDLEAGAIDPGQGWDILANRPVARDPLDYSGNPGHGTATASVVASRGAGAVMGSAPAAVVYPIRCIKAVTVVTAEPVARAIEKAVEARAGVITMSLGGVPSRALRTALRQAREAGVIVLAAAGNCVRLVVWPARYPECIAVAGCNIEGRAWRGSCRGRAIDITAPAQQVWHASATAPEGYKHGQGTSFAVALAAGAAAQWLAHHTPSAVRAEADERRVSVQDLFREALQETAEPAAHLDPHEFGPGVVNIEKLLRKELRDIRAVRPPREQPGDDPGNRVPPEYTEILREFGADAEAADIDWRRYGAEVGEVALRRAISARAEGVELAESAPAPATERLRAAARQAGNEALQRLLGRTP